MADHTHRTITRHADVAIVGGSAAGLAAALQLSRQRRSVIVVDDATPRNAPAARVHGYLGHEGVSPSELTSAARDEVRSYGAEVLSGRVTTAETADEGRLRLALTGGHAVLARRVLVATGLVDELPDIDGLAQHWGHGVVHCPFCHGYELRDRRVVAIVTHPMGLHPVALYRQLTEHLVVLIDDRLADPGAVAASVDVLVAAGVRVESGRAQRIDTGEGDRVRSVVLTDGRRFEADVVAISPRFLPRIEPFVQLGLRAAVHPSGMGHHVEVDVTGRTSVTGVYAAGNVTDPSQQVLHAAADGSRVGAMLALALAEEDLTVGAWRSGNEVDWEHRYSGDPIWSGNPNGTLVAEVTGRAPGRALDVGAGEGGDAVWLAEQGWHVTASDISARALDRVAAEAARRGLPIVCHHTDANAPDAYPEAGFDLVSAQYASIPRTRDDRAIHNILRAVAPGGTLLVVGHDLEPMRQPVDPAQHSRAFDPDAYVRVDDVAAALAGEPDWHIERHERRPRPPGAVSSHHVDDIVLRARRR